MPDIYEIVNATQLDSDLEDIADAIRAKTGGQSALDFPNEFISEITSIPTGGASITGATDVTVKALETITQGDTLYIYKAMQTLFAPNPLPAGNGKGCAFSPNGTRFAIAHETTPYISIYDTTTIPYTKLTNPGTLPTGNGNGCAFSPNGTWLAVGHNASPFTTIYNTSGQTQASKALNKSRSGIAYYGYAKSSIASGSTGTAAVLFEP